MACFSMKRGGFLAALGVALALATAAIAQTGPGPIPPLAATYPLIFGTGADGNVTINAGTTTLTRDVHYANLTINGTGALNTNGFKVFVNGILDLSTAPAGAIIANGGNGTTAVSAAGGASSIGAYNYTPSSLLILNGYGSGSGGTGNTTTGSAAGNAVIISNGNGGSSAQGGTGGTGVSAGGAGGTTNTTWLSNSTAVIYNRPGVDLFLTSIGGSSQNYQSVTAGSPGGNGGQGGGDGVNAGGGGGGAGGAGGQIYLAAYTIARGVNATAGIIQMKGGNGGGGANGVAGTAGGGGGASGAGGGWLYLVTAGYTGSVITNAIDVSGGAGGTGGNSLTTGKGGNGAASGNSGHVQKIQIGASPSFSISAFNVAGNPGGTTVTVTGGAGGTQVVTRVNL